MCCFSQLSLLAEQLGQLIRIDPFGVLPREVSLKVLAHLDATSLSRCSREQTVESPGQRRPSRTRTTIC
jgi:F-box/WD-40 domain protein MET30